ncbi:MAG: diacylglycerol kinase [Candidatus Magnetoovum sp. WYHC-5]|nr:diacylglycerol kinase [Candidatus Magnetoovum sp. WYHC-5]
MPLKRWIDSANNAIEGILTAAKTQRHIRYHLYAAFVVLMFSYIVGVTKTEFLVIALTTLFVIMAELVNTAIEVMVDILSPQLREEARIAKDVAAGAVLVTAFGAAIIGYIVLFPYMVGFFQKGFYVAVHPNDEIAVLALIVVMIAVVLLKAFFGKGLPLRGGMPSGHCALSFSIWVSITVITENIIVSVLSFIVALVIAQSRVALKVHTPVEAFLGSLLGIFITYVLFVLFNS